jgi:hypothetical protein
MMLPNACWTFFLMLNGDRLSTILIDVGLSKIKMANSFYLGARGEQWKAGNKTGTLAGTSSTAIWFVRSTKTARKDRASEADACQRNVQC